MEEFNTTATESETICQCCKQKVTYTDSFCQNCGFPLKGTQEEQGKFIGQYITRKGEKEEWKNQVKNAKITLLVLAGLTILFGLIALNTNTEGEGVVDFLIYAIIAGIYGFLAWWSDKNPFGAVLTGLIVYVALNILTAIVDPLTIFSGVIWKVLIISYLIKGVAGAAKVRNVKV